MKDNPVGWAEAEPDAFARPSNRYLLLFCGHEKISRAHENYDFERGPWTNGTSCLSRPTLQRRSIIRNVVSSSSKKQIDTKNRLSLPLLSFFTPVLKKVLGKIFPSIRGKIKYVERKGNDDRGLDGFSGKSGEYDTHCSSVHGSAVR